MAIRYYHRELLGHSLTQSKEMYHEAIAKRKGNDFESYSQFGK